MVNSLISIHVKKYQDTGAQLVMGQAQFTGPKTIEVARNDGGNVRVIAERVFLNLEHMLRFL